jgi:hypothetical protein
VPEKDRDSTYWSGSIYCQNKVTTMFVLCGESRMKYTGRRGSDVNVHT